MTGLNTISDRTASGLGRRSEGQTGLVVVVPERLLSLLEDSRRRCARARV
jgi:hypothetical protein